MALSLSQQCFSDFSTAQRRWLSISGLSLTAQQQMWLKSLWLTTESLRQWENWKTNKSVKTPIGYSNLKIEGMKRKPQTPDHLWSFGGTEVVFIQIWPANHWTLLIKYHLEWKKRRVLKILDMRSWGVLVYSRLRWSLHNWMPFWGKTWSWLMKIDW